MISGKKYISKIIRGHLNEMLSKELIVFHGTKPKFVNSIVENGLEDKTSTPYQQGWYMVSTDFNSALFHADPGDGKILYVFEFKIPITKNERWFGYPYLWKGTELKDNSTWFALMEKLPPDLISKIHKVSYDKWIDVKNNGF